MSERVSVWLATHEAAEYPALTERVEVDVAVIGGGITGMTTALFLQRDGARVAVVERNRIGQATTGHTTGKITAQHGLIYRELIERHGETAAGHYADANQWAIRTISELAGELAPEANFRRAPAFVFSRDPARQSAIEDEHLACLRLNVPAVLTNETDLPFAVEIALRLDDQAHIDAVSYCAGLAREIVRRGGLIFEETPALGIEEEDDRVTVRTGPVKLTASHAVIATLLPFVDRSGLFAKTSPGRSYGVAARLRTEPPVGMYISAESPTRSVRPWGDLGVIIVGENHRTGTPEAAPGRWGELERWGRDHFAVDSFDYRWSAQDYETVDGLPYVGRAPRMRRTSVATGYKKWGLTNATAAAQMLTDLINNRENQWLETFAATRMPGVRGFKTLAVTNVKVGKHLVMGTLSRLRAPDLSTLERGQAGMVEVDGTTVGAYRNADGDIHAVGLTCTHLGCTVAWNDAERSWDCPCHGSRFSIDGRVLEGPAVKDLVRFPIDKTS